MVVVGFVCWFCVAVVWVFFFWSVLCLCYKLRILQLVIIVTGIHLSFCYLVLRTYAHVVFSDRMVLDPVRKSIVINRYKTRLQQIPCKHFSYGRGNCPFGSSCFYAHRNEVLPLLCVRT